MISTGEGAYPPNLSPTTVHLAILDMFVHSAATNMQMATNENLVGTSRFFLLQLKLIQIFYIPPRRLTWCPEKLPSQKESCLPNNMFEGLY